MKYLIFILLLGHVFCSCSQGNNTYPFEKELQKIENWNIEIIRGEIDTNIAKSFVPMAEIQLKFINKNDSSCSNPWLDIYPIQLENYMEKKLVDHFTLRSSIFPLFPNKYITDKYLILAWNFYDSYKFSCCECISLENELIDKLNLQVIDRQEHLNKENRR